MVHTGWIQPDSRGLTRAFVYTYRLEGIDETGRTIPISPKSMAPYDFAFTWNLFDYLYPDKQLEIRYGNARNPQTASRLRSISSKAQLFTLEQEFGSSFFDEDATNKYRKFLREFFSELNRQPKAKWLRYLQRPADLICFRSQDSWTEDTRIQTVVCYRVTTLFDGTMYDEVRTEELMKVEID